jgi:hypothetical protein
MSEGSRQDPRDQPEHPGNGAEPMDSGVASRRQLLRFGAATATVVLTVRPGIAQAATSVLNCQIPVPDPSRASMAIAPDGTMVAKGTVGSFPGGRTFSGEEVRTGLRGGNLPGASYEEGQAYLNYVRKLQSGRSGFTCYASLMMAR